MLSWSGFSHCWECTFKAVFSQPTGERLAPLVKDCTEQALVSCLLISTEHFHWDFLLDCFLLFFTRLLCAIHRLFIYPLMFLLSYCFSAALFTISFTLGFTYFLPWCQLLLSISIHLFIHACADIPVFSYVIFVHSPLYDGIFTVTDALYCPIPCPFCVPQQG